MALQNILNKASRQPGSYPFGPRNIPNNLSTGSATLVIDRTGFPPDDGTEIVILEVEFSWNNGATFGEDFIEIQPDGSKKLYSGRHRFGIRGGDLVDRFGNPVTQSRIRFDFRNLPVITNREFRGVLTVTVPVEINLSIDA